MGTKFSFKARARSFAFAFKGISEFIKTQHNGWIHLFAAAAVTVAGVYFKLSASEWVMVVFAMGFVFSSEIMNTAVEYLVDLVSPDFNKTAGKVKDLAAAAVLLAAITAAIIGMIVFFPKVIALF